MNIKGKILSIFFIFCFSLGISFADKARQFPELDLVASTTHPWHVMADIGYGNYQDMYSSDGETPLARLGFGRNLFLAYGTVFGLEIGVENGNTMRLAMAQSTLDQLGGLPFQTSVKAFVDFLLTIKVDIFNSAPFFEEIKVGPAYRLWQFNDHNTIESIGQIATEVIAGFAYQMTERASLGLYYQGVFGGSPDFKLDLQKAGGTVSNIPSQFGVLFGITLVI